MAPRGCLNPLEGLSCLGRIDALMLWSALLSLTATCILFISMMFWYQSSCSMVPCLLAKWASKMERNLDYIEPVMLYEAVQVLI